MELLMHLLLATIPALVLAFTIYFSLKAHFDKEVKLKASQDNQGKMETIIPLKLQAYERLVLLMERIEPANLLPRSAEAGITAAGLQQVLVNNVRTEFEHNLAQQLYVSDEVWKKIVESKEEILSLIHHAAGEVDPNAEGLVLGRQILEHLARKEKSLTESVIRLLKTEAATI